MNMTKNGTATFFIEAFSGYKFDTNHLKLPTRPSPTLSDASVGILRTSMVVHIVKHAPFTLIYTLEIFNLHNICYFI